MTALLAIEPFGGYCARVIPYAYDEAARQQFKSMPGIDWVRDSSAPNGRGYYEGDATAVRIIATLLESAGVVKLQQRSASQAAPAPVPCPELPSTLYPFQADGVRWLRTQLMTTDGAVLADEMGLGKTVQALVAARSLGVQRMLVVCPAIAARPWVDVHAKRWAPDIEVTAFSWQKFARLKLTPPADLVCFDELHYASNPRTARSKAAARWCYEHPHAMRLGLTGTPMLARPRDLHHPLDLIWPGRWGRPWLWQQRYCDGRWEEITGLDRKVWNSEGASRLEELATRLAPCMLRRTKAQAGADLPPLTRVVTEVEIPKRARGDLRRALRTIDWGGSAAVLSAGVASLLSDVESHKIDAACELANEVMAAGSRCLLLTTRKLTAQQLGERLGCPWVTGDDPPATRAARIGDAQCAAATLYAVQEAIDLIGFNVAVFTGLDWLPTRLLQAEARCHRIGSQRNVTVHYLVGLETIDEVVKERVIERLDHQSIVLGAREGDEAGLAADLRGDEGDLLGAIVARLGEL